MEIPTSKILSFETPLGRYSYSIEPILNKLKLRSILEAAGNAKVYIFSICGEYATEPKIYLRNAFYNFFKDKTTQFVERTSWCPPPVDSSAGSEERTTPGVWITAKPIIINKFANPIAIYLAETHKNADTDDDVCRLQDEIMLNFCFQISSYILFNTNDDTGRDQVLGTLEKYGSFLRRQEQYKSVGMCLLLNDWQETELYPFGEVGGSEYLEKKLREQNVKSINLVKCFLLPRCSELFVNPEMQNGIGDFTKLLESLFNSIWEDGNISTAFGNLNLGEFVMFMEEFIHTQTDSTSGDMSGGNDLHELINTLRLEYQTRLLREIETSITCTYLPTLILQKHHEFIKRDCKQKLTKSINSDASTLLKFENELETEIEKRYAEISDTNSTQFGLIKAKVEEAFQNCIQMYTIQVQELLSEVRHADQRFIFKNQKIIMPEIQRQLAKHVRFDRELLNEQKERLNKTMDKILLEQTEIYDASLLREKKSQIEKIKSNIETEYMNEMKGFTNQWKYRSPQQLREFDSRLRTKIINELKSKSQTRRLQDEDISLVGDGLNEKFTQILAENEVKPHTMYDYLGPIIKEFNARMEKECNINHIPKLTKANLSESYHKHKHSSLSRLRSEMEQAGNFEKEEEQAIMAELEAQLKHTYDVHLASHAAIICQQKTALTDKLIKKYSTKMKTQLEQTPIIIEIELEAIHNSIVNYLTTTWIANNDSASKDVTSNDNFVSDVREKLQDLFKTYLGKTNADLIKYKQSIDKYMKSWLLRSFEEELIREGLQIKVNLSVESGAKFNAVYNSLIDKYVQDFTQFCIVRHESFTTPYINKLKSSMNKSYQNEKALLDLKINEHEVMMQKVQLQAAGLYESEMEKHFASTPFLKPVKFYQKHEAIVNTILRKNQINELSDGNKERLNKCVFDPLFKRYNDTNTINTPYENGLAIGIDLGTTNTCVAVYHRGKVEVVRSQCGENTIPSFVAFCRNHEGDADDDFELIGQPAKAQAHENPSNTIYDAKRLIGRAFDDQAVQNDIKLWPFKVSKAGNGSNNPVIIVQGKETQPEIISAKILKHVKELVEHQLQISNLTKVVITVPAFFNDGQKQATKDAAKLAGLEILQLLSEPTAAAMAYYLNYTRMVSISDNNSECKNVLVYDLGGGTFDVSILNINAINESIQVKAVHGDTHLGGEDFDHALVSFSVQNFLAKTGIDLTQGRCSEDPLERNKTARLLRRLHNVCELRKKDLTESNSTRITLDEVIPGHDLNVTVTREDFESMNQANFLKTINIMEQALLDAKLSKENVDEIILIGGSSRIPKLRELIKSYFDGKELCLSLDPIEAVARGAALLAAKLNGQLEHQTMSFTDVNPLSIGIELYDGKHNVLIPRNTTIPHRIERDYKTATDYQERVTINIYEGEKQIAEQNHLLGKFTLINIPKKKKGEETIHVTMEISKHGILHVSARCDSTGSYNEKIIVQENKGRLTTEEINQTRL